MLERSTIRSVCIKQVDCDVFSVYLVTAVWLVKKISTGKIYGRIITQKDHKGDTRYDWRETVFVEEGGVQIRYSPHDSLVKNLVTKGSITLYSGSREDVQQNG